MGPDPMRDNPPDRPGQRTERRKWHDRRESPEETPAIALRIK